VDYLTFISEVIKSFVWPITILLIIYLLRDEISKIFLQLKSLKYKDFEANFGEKIASMKYEADQLGLPPPSEPISEESPKERFMKMAENCPLCAVSEAWIIVENAIKYLAVRYSISDKLSHYQIMSELFSKGVLSNAEMRIYNDLLRLRNKCVHSTPDSILDLTSDQANDYRILALRFIAELNNK
jgi:hypothetical protein